MNAALSATARILPGTAVASAIVICCVLLKSVSPLGPVSPLLLAVLIGMVLGNIRRMPAPIHPGLRFSSRTVLRFAIGLLGLQLSVAQIATVGIAGLFVVVSTVVVTFVAIIWMATLLGVDLKLACLLAAGTSICGASAVAAMSTVSQASEEDVTYAMATVTALGTLLMFLLPPAGHFLELSSTEFGVWTGASIHEVAQVTGAAFQFSVAAGETGVVIKLMRVLMLAPLLLLWTIWSRFNSTSNSESVVGSAFPIFVVGFIGAVIVNSVMPIPADTRASLMTITTFLMTVALAALGLQTRFSRLTAKGARPLMLGMLGTVLIVGVSASLVMVAGGFK